MCGLLWLLSLIQHVLRPSHAAWGGVFPSFPSCIMSHHGVHRILVTPASVDACIFGLFPPFGNCQECCYGHAFSGCAPAVESLGHRHLHMSPAEEAPACCPSDCAFSRPAGCAWDHSRLQRPLSLFFLLLYYESPPLGVKWRLVVVWTCISRQVSSLYSLVVCLSPTRSPILGSKKEVELGQWPPSHFVHRAPTRIWKNAFLVLF